MSHHPWGQAVEMFGIKSPTNGHCCEEHTICGAVLTEDSVVKFRKVQVIINDKEESAIAVLWVLDSVDWCRVSFLPQHHVKHWMKLEGVLGQIMVVYTGDSDSPTKHQKHYQNSSVAIAAIISGPLLVAKPGSLKKCKVNKAIQNRIMMIAKTVALFLMISKNIIYPSLLSSSSSLMLSLSSSLGNQ